jgi:hypothetical protein
MCRKEHYKRQFVFKLPQDLLKESLRHFFVRVFKSIKVKKEFHKTFPICVEKNITNANSSNFNSVVLRLDCILSKKRKQCINYKTVYLQFIVFTYSQSLVENIQHCSVPIGLIFYRERAS